MEGKLLDGTPAGTLDIDKEWGCKTAEVFVKKWLKHFQTYAKATLDEKVILIVDGIDAMNFAIENGIGMICLPLHSTHRLQHRSKHISVKKYRSG